jgi:archaeosine-15-forming tRNA-guanine transglycosylase
LIPDEVRHLAEEQGTPGVRWPGSELIEREHFAIWLGPPMYPGLSVVRRCRFGVMEAASAAEEVRAVLRERGRSRAIWQVGASAIPATLADDLIAFGLEPDSDPVCMAIVIGSPPIGESGSDVVVRRATTRDEFEAFFRIQQEAFEIDPEAIERGAESLDEIYEGERTADHVATYLAYVDDEPVATARATFTEFGVVLNGGSTLHRARGKGAYRALVHARWNDAVAHGTPWMTTLARPTSYPILKKMGFEDVCDVRMLVDEF